MLPDATEADSTSSIATARGTPTSMFSCLSLLPSLFFSQTERQNKKGFCPKNRGNGERNGRVHGCQGARGRAMNIRGDTRKIVKRASRKATRTDTTDGVRWLFWEGWLNSFQFFFPVSRLLCPFDVCRRSSPSDLRSRGLKNVTLQFLVCLVLILACASSQRRQNSFLLSLCDRHVIRHHVTGAK